MEPYTRKEKLYSNILGADYSIEPFTREEKYLDEIAKGSKSEITIVNDNLSYTVQNNIVTLFVTTKNSNRDQWEVLGVMPEGIRPNKFSCITIAVGSALSNTGMIAIYSNGEVKEYCNTSNIVEGYTYTLTYEKKVVV